MLQLVFHLGETLLTEKTLELVRTPSMTIVGLQGLFICCELAALWASDILLEQPGKGRVDRVDQSGQ